ncbi:response regulator [Scytonema sp. PRP1]|uniref:response regulator n=1 Tax=Scytonema sp. PRP1 TaxID=3120513 RepID=UPI002FD69171
MYNHSLPLNGLRVLVVDSDLDSRVLLTMVFEEYGVETIAATSAFEALEIVKQVKPDLLISEISLPNEDGYSLMRKVKALENARQVEIPAMALTTYDGEDDRAHALSVGFEKHLPKPFDIDELIITVACLTKQVQWELTV